MVGALCRSDRITCRTAILVTLAYSEEAAGLRLQGRKRTGDFAGKKNVEPTVHAQLLPGKYAILGVTTGLLIGKSGKSAICKVSVNALGLFASFLLSIKG
jgi:hypothetical protein